MNASELLHAGVSAAVLDQRKDLAESFQNGRPFRHVVIDNFFTSDLCTRLSDNFPAFDDRLAVNENGIVGNKAVNEKIMELGPDWRELDALVQDDSFRDLISGITGIPDLQYDPHYFGGGTHENRHGQGLDAHVDFNFHPITRQHRRLNLIVYLNEDWQPEWGGSIQLRKDPYRPPAEDELTTVTPSFNRCVIFETTEHSWHGFPRIDLPEDKRSLSRRSFALYYYTDTRPDEETGPEHSTIYVNAHLSDDFHAGMELSTDQLQHIQSLLSERDQHIRRLYGDIKELNSVYNRLKEYRGQQQEELDSLRKAFEQQQQSYERELNEARGHVQRLDEAITGKDDYIREVTGNLEEKDQRIIQQNQSIEERNRTIRQQSRSLEEQNQSIEEQNQRIEESHRIIDQQNLDIEDGQQTVDRLRSQISDLKSSTSWRITRPIRWLKKKLVGDRRE